MNSTFLPCRSLLLLSVGMVTFLLAPECTATAEESATAQKETTLKTDVTVEIDYLLYLPKDYDKQESWPLVLFLHGAGERGDNLDLVKKHGPPKLIEQGQDFPFIVVSPQCPAGKWWEPFELLALLDDISERYNVDDNRVYLTGLSMGGFGTWRLASHAPERFAAIAPICGGGERFSARQLTKMPIWAFHGAKDSVVPLERSEAMVEAVKRYGGEAKLTVYPEATHDSWTATYDNPELYKWLLEQKRAN